MLIRPLVAILSFTLGVTLTAQSDTVTVRIAHAPGCDTTFTLARLRQMPVHSAMVTSHDGEQATYEGALLWDVVAAGCASVPASPKRDRIGMVVRIDATDGYHAVIALMEADTSFRERPALLCWRKNGALLDGHDGPLQVIVPDDRRHARNVRQVRRLTITAP